MAKQIIKLLTPYKIEAISINDCKGLQIINVFSKCSFSMPNYVDISGQACGDIFSYSADVPQSNIYVIPNGKCIIGKEEAYTDNNEVIREITSQKSNPMIGKSALKLHTYLNIKGSVLNLCLSGLENNYYHFNVEFLGRYYIYYCSKLAVDWIIFPQNTTFQKEYLALLNIDKRKLLDLDENCVVKADTLICPDLINNWRYTYYRGHVSYLKEWVPLWLKNVSVIMNRSNSNKDLDCKRLYISRSKARYRKILNEDALVHVLEKYGFNKYNLEDLSVSDQIDLFSNTEILIAPHGAGLINMNHCNNKVVILEIYPQFYHDSSFRIQATMLGFKYAFAIGTTPTTTGIHPHDEDIFVDVEAIENWLNKTLQI